MNNNNNCNNTEIKEEEKKDKVEGVTTSSTTTTVPVVPTEQPDNQKELVKDLIPTINVNPPPFSPSPSTSSNSISLLPQSPISQPLINETKEIITPIKEIVQNEQLQSTPNQITPIQTPTPSPIIEPSFVLHSPPLSGKYLPLTPHLSKLDQIRMISEYENHFKPIPDLESLFIEKNKMILSPEKPSSNSAFDRLSPNMMSDDRSSSPPSLGGSTGILFDDHRHVDLTASTDTDTDEEIITLEVGRSLSNISNDSNYSNNPSDDIIIIEKEEEQDKEQDIVKVPEIIIEKDVEMKEAEKVNMDDNKPSIETTEDIMVPIAPQPPNKSTFSSSWSSSSSTLDISDTSSTSSSTSTTSTTSSFTESQKRISSKTEKVLSFLGFIKKNKEEKDTTQSYGDMNEDYLKYLSDAKEKLDKDEKAKENQKLKLPKPSSDDGHVFLLYGDLTKLVCDVKMVPCSHHSVVRVAVSSWLKSDWNTFPPDIRNKISTSTPPEPFKKGLSRVYKLNNWPTEYPNISQPWFVTVVPDFRYYERLGAEWYIEGARSFLNEVGKDLAKNKPKIKNGRSKYLVALPILGTGGGGGSSIAGSILSMLLQELYLATRVWKYDVVLVTNELPMYTAARNKRKEMMTMDSDYTNIYSSVLSPDMLEKARQLSKLLDQGKLALFLGAGCSFSAGLPSWVGLLTMLGEKLGMTPDEMRAMEQLHYLDRATVLESRWKKALDKYSPPVAPTASDSPIRRSFEGPDGASGNPLDGISSSLYSELHKKLYNEINIPMQEEIANLMKVTHAGLPHFLLASTPATDIITTNYDRCFEIASNSVGTSCCVLPYDTLAHYSEHKRRWILKLHGCVSRPSDIVITREDYIRYGDKREALSGILQSSLITQHILFIGYSLIDETFFNVMSAVKSATQQTKQKRKFGTALFIQKNDLMSELWGNQIDFVCFDPNGTGDISKCARKQEIFIEYLASISINNTSHLMEQRFDCLLQEGEKIFRDHIIKFVEELPDEAKDTQVFKKFETFLHQVGYRSHNKNYSKVTFG